MKIKHPADWRITTKILSAFLCLTLFFAAGIAFVYQPFMESKVFDKKKETVQSEVQTAWSVMKYYNNLASSGKLSLAEAKERARKLIGGMRFEGDDYFFIIDHDTKCVMHPIKPQLNGTDLSNIKDRDGKFLFHEMVKAVSKDGAGYVSYQWPKPGKSEPQPKISYVQSFNPWGWIVGSGIYFDDIAAEMSAIRWTVGVAGIVIFIIVSIMSFLLSHTITRPIIDIASRLKGLATGDADLTQRIPLKAKNENELSNVSEEIAWYFNAFVSRIRGIVADVRGEMDKLNRRVDQMVVDADNVKDNMQEVMGFTSNVAETVDTVNNGISNVAAAMEEMTATISEIASNTGQASAVANEATSEADGTGLIIQRFVESARKISEVSQIIGTIAEQTNLLSLNATIEAARAGEAGKGFAVVANEVKELAKQTGGSVEEINEVVNDLQKESDHATRAMNRILQTISSVAEYSQSIASAVEEQTATTSEVSASTQEVAGEIGNVSELNQGIGERCDSAFTNAAKLNEQVKKISEDSKKVQDQLAAFKV